jgi:Ecdysteroid kinase-like family
MVKKSNGFKKEEMEVVLKKLAQFHAASAVYVEQNGKFGEKFSYGVYNPGMQDIFTYHFDFNFAYVMDEFIGQWPNLDKEIPVQMVSMTKFSTKADELILVIAAGVARSSLG